MKVDVLSADDESALLCEIDLAITFPQKTITRMTSVGGVLLRRRGLPLEALIRSVTIVGVPLRRKEDPPYLLNTSSYPSFHEERSVLD